MRNGLLVTVFVIGALVFLVLGVELLDSLPGLLVDEQVAVRALETQGFTEVKIIDREWFAVDWQGCSDDDVVKFTASATNPAGKQVQLYVCAGWPFKGATVRTD